MPHWWTERGKNKENNSALSLPFSAQKERKGKNMILFHLYPALSKAFICCLPYLGFVWVIKVAFSCEVILIMILSSEGSNNHLNPGQTDSQDFCWLWSSSNSYVSRRKFFTIWPPNASRHKLIASQLCMREIDDFLRLANPFGHPSQVRTQVLLLQTCVDLRVRLARALK